MCVQICKDWDLATDMHKPGWGIIYLLIIHKEHLDLHKYNKAVSLDRIAVSKGQEHVDNTTAKKKAKVLRSVKHKEQEDKEAGSCETNPRIIQLSVQLKVKKACTS